MLFSKECGVVDLSGILRSTTSVWRMAHAPVQGIVLLRKADVLGSKSRMAQILLIGSLEVVRRKASVLGQAVIILLATRKVSVTNYISYIPGDAKMSTSLTYW